MFNVMLPQYTDSLADSQSQFQIPGTVLIDPALLNASPWFSWFQRGIESCSSASSRSCVELDASTGPSTRHGASHTTFAWETEHRCSYFKWAGTSQLRGAKLLAQSDTGIMLQNQISNPGGQLQNLLSTCMLNY